MDDLDRRYVQMTFDRDYPPVPPDVVADATPAKGSRQRAQENAPGVDDAALALMDTLAGGLKGAVAQVIGLPGDIESLYRLIADGQQRMLTTEDVQKLLPPVVPAGGDPAKRAAREKTAKVAEEAGTFLPVAPVGIVKAAKRMKIGADGKRVATEPSK